MNNGNETRELARFVTATTLEQVPESARVAARRSLLNWFGCAIAGSRQEAVTFLMDGLAAADCSGRVPVIGRNERLNALSATLVNGTSSAVLDFDSPQHKRTNIHPSGPIAPALLALSVDGRTSPVSGSDFLLAYILGVEIACRIANVMFGSQNPGWHVTGVAGGPGAAVGCGRLLELSETQVAAAIGIAATQGSGLREMYGTMCKALTPGRSGENGLLAALLAARGFTSSSRPLEGTKGVAAVFNGLSDITDISAGLGVSFEIEAMAHKPYPCAVVTHAVIDACIELANRPVGDDVRRIDLMVSPIALELAGKMDPQDELEAKFSLSHAAAIALTYRSASVEHFTRESLNNIHVSRLSKLVQVRTEADFWKEEASVVVHTESGMHELHVKHATGSRNNPMTEEQLIKKFMGLAEGTIGEAQAATLSKRLLAIEEIDDMSSLLQHCAPSAVHM